MSKPFAVTNKKGEKVVIKPTGLRNFVRYTGQKRLKNENIGQFMHRMKVIFENEKSQLQPIPQTKTRSAYRKAKTLSLKKYQLARERKELKKAESEGDKKEIAALKKSIKGRAETLREKTGYEYKVLKEMRAPTLKAIREDYELAKRENDMEGLERLQKDISERLTQNRQKRVKSDKVIRGLKIDVPENEENYIKVLKEKPAKPKKSKKSEEEKRGDKIEKLVGKLDNLRSILDSMDESVDPKIYKATLAKIRRIEKQLNSV